MGGQHGLPTIAARQRLRQVSGKAAQHIDQSGPIEGFDYGRVICGFSIYELQGVDINGTQAFKPVHAVLPGTLMIVVRRCRRRYNTYA
jgi:hypothetical protein